MHFSNDRVSVFLLPEPDMIETEFSIDIGTRYRDAILLGLPGGEAWVFDYGVIVFWGIDEDERLSLLHRLKFAGDILACQHQEHFRFTVEGSELKLQRDLITLGMDTPLQRLSISHALAQSIKLNDYEQRAQDTILTYAHLPKALAATGKIKLSPSEIAKIRGHLFSTKSDIFLHYGLLDIPEFFWEYPEYEMAYQATARYMDIRTRVELLTNKLNVIHELFEMLADELKHKHSSFLEWIIIVLIAFEIVMFGAHELMNLLFG
ncbi:RMD1 family protein [Salinimonas lutimaris]|uniref:RMD1 family protein n=1 Tax=Salinimonas lutimaris TaxID=914153 RepID=UPI0010C0DD30|nr:RMD1 family protein [Salinimonas lutimaris]